MPTASWRVLASGHAVDTVVYDDGRDVDVSPGRMNKMIASDGDGVPSPMIAITLRPGLANFTRGKREGTTVGV